MQQRWRNPHKPKAVMVLRPLDQRQPRRLAVRPIRECRSLNTIAKRENRRRRCYTMGRRANRRRQAQPMRLRQTQFVRSSRYARLSVGCHTGPTQGTRSDPHQNLFPGEPPGVNTPRAGEIASWAANACYGSVTNQSNKARARVPIAVVTHSAVYQTLDVCRGETE
jgi:hypothetical protein